MATCKTSYNISYAMYLEPSNQVLSLSNANVNQSLDAGLVVYFDMADLQEAKALLEQLKHLKLTK